MDTNYKRAKFLATLLDSQFEIAGVRFGIDPVVNIIPGLGDVIGVFLSLYVLNIAREMNASRFDIFRMVLNILLDFILGFIPFLGVLFDVVYKANIRNLHILEKYKEKTFPDSKVIEGETVVDS